MGQPSVWNFAFFVVAGALLLQGSPQKAQQKRDSPADETVYEMGEGVTPPRVIKQVNPRYATAKGVRVEGAVTVALVVSSQGMPRDVRVIKGLDKDIDQSAVDAVQQWRFAAARKNDKPIAVRISLEIDFHSM
jgi:TonB family protein